MVIAEVKIQAMVKAAKPEKDTVSVHKLDREYLRSQESQNADRKVFHRDTLEISQLSENVEDIRERMKHTVLQSAALFSDTRAGILEKVREEKGQYSYSDVVNVVGLSYARLYSEMEERYENQNEQYYKIDGTPLTKEDEIEWLNKEYENEVEWQKACAKAAAQREVFLGHISSVPTKEIDELEDSFYQARDTYMKLHQENKQVGKPLTLQNNVFGNTQMYEKLDKLRNL